MPVSILLSEGGLHSPDVRILGKLLAGRCEIKPAGGKYGMGTRIIARREAMGNHTVFGILDSDFREEWQNPGEKPQPWVTSDGTVLGWRWERKEIENYLIDPVVVRRALKESAPNQESYLHSLKVARDKVATYQAARTSLSVCRPRFTELPSSFGRERGRKQHLFPDELDQGACIEGIRKVVATHQETQVVPCALVEERFGQLLPDFESGGSRYDHFLTAFSGKDLLWAMNEGIKGLGFSGAWAFQEKVLVGISQGAEDIASWLPEWKALQEAVEQT